MSPSPKKKPDTSKVRASTKVVRPKTPAEQIAERYAGDVHVVAAWRLEAIETRLYDLGMPAEEVDRIMGEIRASVGPNAGGGA